MLDPGPAAVGLVLLLILSGFFSGSETALLAANRYRLSYLARRGHPQAQRVRDLIDHKERLLSTILVGNNFANIAASALATTVAIGIAGERGALYATVMMTVLVLIFSEIAPKTLAARYPEKISFLVSRPIGLMVLLLRPFAGASVWVSSALLHALGKSGGESTAVSEEDIRGMISLGDDEVRITRDKRRMMHGIFSLEDLSIGDVMIPRTRVVALHVEASPDDIIAAIRSSGFTRFPVCRGTLDEIIGVLNSKDVFKYTDRLEELDIEALARKPLFVPETAPLQVLLQAFRHERQHLAIVIDEYGGVEGIVSLEDLLEEIVGEIDDEFDLPRVPQVAELDDGSLRVAGSCPLALLNRRYGLGLASEDNSTLAGRLLELWGRIPEVGESIRDGQIEFVIERGRPHRIDQVRVIRGGDDQSR